MAPGLKSVKFEAVRVTVHSEQPFDTVIENLYAEIGRPEQARVVKSLLADVRDVASFTNAIRKATGTPPEQDVTDRFMIFQEFDHGAWVPIFGVGGGRKHKRILLGNPFIAITMLRHDMRAGLSVPVELLVTESMDEGNGGVDLVYHLPSALIAAGGGNTELKAAAQNLDEKLRKLVLQIAS